VADILMEWTEEGAAAFGRSAASCGVYSTKLEYVPLMFIIKFHLLSSILSNYYNGSVFLQWGLIHMAIKPH